MSRFIRDTTFALSPRVQETHLYYLNAAEQPMEVYIIKAHLKRNKLSLEATTAFNKDTFARQTLTQQIQEKNTTSHEVLAGVNAGFFNMETGEPVEVSIIDGYKIKDTVLPKRYFVGVKKNGKVIMGDAEFYQRKKEQLKAALGGTPLLIKNGKILPQSDRKFSTIRHPRTALGTINKRTVLLVVVDGRQPQYGNGMPLKELAILMKTLGAKNAINLDGGGSTTLVSQSQRSKDWKIRNRPSGGQQRQIANAWVIVKN